MDKENYTVITKVTASTSRHGLNTLNYSRQRVPIKTKTIDYQSMRGRV